MAGMAAAAASAVLRLRGLRGGDVRRGVGADEEPRGRAVRGVVGEEGRLGDGCLGEYARGGVAAEDGGHVEVRGESRGGGGGGIDCSRDAAEHRARRERVPGGVSGDVAGVLHGEFVRAVVRHRARDATQGVDAARGAVGVARAKPQQTPSAVQREKLGGVRSVELEALEGGHVGRRHPGIEGGGKRAPERAGRRVPNLGREAGETPWTTSSPRTRSTRHPNSRYVAPADTKPRDSPRPHGDRHSVHARTSCPPAARIPERSWRRWRRAR